ncbi:MAG: CDGSH iron-sulfur domain-containing protein [Anaerolineaceae bacterium]
MSQESVSTILPGISIARNGPYIVEGPVPLVRKTQIVSEYGEPLSWQLLSRYEVSKERYRLCSCGNSKQMPFCDNTHLEKPFDGKETASTDGSTDDSIVLPGGKQIIVHLYPDLCMSSGFCNLRNTGIVRLTAESEDTLKRSLAMAMIERCPSGALTYQLDPDEPDVEPDLPQEIAETFEITSQGPIRGPLWVTGYLRINRSDGVPFAARNRVTLCCCGNSHNKPLCDGTHRRDAEWEAEWKKK